MIHVENVKKEFPGHVALDNVSFYLEKGDVVGFLGPNGAGKSTLMRILAGILPACSGVVRIRDVDLCQNPNTAKESIGYLPESVALYPDMTVVAYLEFMALMRQVPKKQIKARVKEVVALAQLRAVQNKIIRRLSRGFQQRVGLAQALIHDPPIVILDEPSSGLDPKQIRLIRTLIRGVAQDRTVILSSHLLSEVTALCDKVVVMDKGRIIVDDTIDLLRLKDAKKLEMQVLTPKLNVLEKVQALDAVSHVEACHQEELWTLNITATSHDHDCREDLFGLAVKQGWTVLELKTVVSSLEDLFLRLMEEEDDA